MVGVTSLVTVIDAETKGSETLRRGDVVTYDDGMLVCALIKVVIDDGRTKTWEMLCLHVDPTEDLPYEEGDLCYGTLPATGVKVSSRVL